MPFREMPCTVCGAPRPTHTCPGCGEPLCDAHAPPPGLLCYECAPPCATCGGHTDGSGCERCGAPRCPEHALPKKRRCLACENDFNERPATIPGPAYLGLYFGALMTGSVIIASMRGVPRGWIAVLMLGLVPLLLVLHWLMRRLQRRRFLRERGVSPALSQAPSEAPPPP
jgi:uncharacterized protein (DUF983 family)